LAFGILMAKKNLLLALGTSLSRSSFLGGSSSLRFVLFRNWHSFAVLGKLEESVSASAADVPVRVVSHECAWGTSGALDLELGNLAGVIDVEVLKNGLGSLLVLVLYLLGLGVNLLLPLFLSSQEPHYHVNG